MPFYDAGDAAVYYRIEGKGNPLILLHGYALNSLMWEFQRQELARNNTLILVDLRGFGKSSCGNEWSGAKMADDVRGLINLLDIKDVSILGFSMSGPVAFRVALEMPDIVNQLIMVSSTLPSPGRPKSGKEAEFQRNEREILRLRGPLAWAEAIGLWKGPLVDGIFRRNPEALPLWERMMSRHNPDYLLRMMDAREKTQSAVNWRERLREIEIPTLMIAGSRDTGFSDSARYLNRNIPNSRLEIVEDSAHMVNLEAPREFNEIIGAFLE